MNLKGRMHQPQLKLGQKYESRLECKSQKLDNNIHGLGIKKIISLKHFN